MLFFKRLYINNFFFYLLLGNIVALLFSYIFTPLYNVSILLFFIILLLFAFDILLLFYVKIGIEATRILPERLSNGDENSVKISIKNFYVFAIHTKIIDEIPIQFQIRNFEIIKKINPLSEISQQYFLRPTQRG